MTECMTAGVDSLVISGGGGGAPLYSLTGSVERELDPSQTAQPPLRAEGFVRPSIISGALFISTPFPPIFFPPWQASRLWRPVNITGGARLLTVRTIYVKAYTVRQEFKLPTNPTLLKDWMKEVKTCYIKVQEKQVDFKTRIINN